MTYRMVYAAVALAALFATGVTAQDRPNVLLIMTDNQSPNQLGVFFLTPLRLRIKNFINEAHWLVNCCRSSGDQSCGYDDVSKLKQGRVKGPLRSNIEIKYWAEEPYSGKVNQYAQR